ncbi:MAG: hypothetical protein ABEI86_11575, partial [Halobacteriaceae archaeon]
IVEQWFVRLLAAGYAGVGGYAAGFIITPFVKEFIPLSSPSTIGFIVGGSFLIVLSIVFWIQVR